MTLAEVLERLRDLYRTLLYRMPADAEHDLEDLIREVEDSEGIPHELLPEEKEESPR